MIRCKRIYEPSESIDGRRVLVDRLWPRNFSKSSLNLTLWIPEISPSSKLRTAFHNREIQFARFEADYRRELDVNVAACAILLDWALTDNLTLVFAAKSLLQNNAVVLASWLEINLINLPKLDY